MAGEKRQRSRTRARNESLRPYEHWVLGSTALSIVASCLVTFLLLKIDAPPTKVDRSTLITFLQDRIVGQNQPTAALVKRIALAQETEAMRVEFLLVGPPGTGKTLLTELMTGQRWGLPGRRLVGGLDITRDRQQLRRLVADVLTTATPGRWFLLALDDVRRHIPEAVLLLDDISLAARAARVPLAVLITATSSDLAGEKGTEAELLAFPEAHLLRFRPLRRSEVAECLRRYGRERNADLDDVTVATVLDDMQYEGQYAVNGCKPAISRLQAVYNFNQTETVGERGEAEPQGDSTLS